MTELKQFSKDHMYLPGIPSAIEIAIQGVDIADINVQFLEKIEELTLYIVELKEEIDLLKHKKKN